MTIEQALKNIKAATTGQTNKSLPITDDLLIDLCDALWDDGQHPQIRLIRNHLPFFHERAITSGFGAWRRARGLHLHYPRWANPHVGSPAALAAMLSPAVSEAPLTHLDKAQGGRRQPPHPKVVAYLGTIANQSVRDVLGLYALIKASLGEDPLYCRLAGYAAPIRKLMEENGLSDVHQIDPDDLLLRVAEHTVPTGLSSNQQSAIVLGWNTLANAFLEYGERLTQEQYQRISPYFLQPLQKRYRMHRSRPSIVVRDSARHNVKAKTDVVHGQFHKLRFMAKIRCNQARRLYEAVESAVAAMKQSGAGLPYPFSYDETVATETGRPVRQRVLLTLWDAVSLWDHAIEKGHRSNGYVEPVRRKRTGRFTPGRERFFVQYRGTEPLGAKATVPFWFIELYQNQVFSERQTAETGERRSAFFRTKGYASRRNWEQTPGLLKPLRRHISSDATYLERVHGYCFLHVEGIYATALFGHTVVRVQTITGARIGEVQQIAQNPDCIKQLQNVGPKASTRWLLRMIPKGRRERADYFIDEDTKDLLSEVVRFQRKTFQTKKLPIVEPRSARCKPDHYLLQWNGVALDQATLNTALRFLLHGAVLDSKGTCLHLTSHLLRHGFATEMASMNVPVDIIAKLLHQRHLEVTRYYSQATKQQVMDAAELLFVERIDVAAEALRSPEQVGKMLREAEGQIGALTEVIGGTCVVSNLCPAKFACIGCAGNAPDPERRVQIETKRNWAVEQVSWAHREKLSAEERQMKRLIQDCDLLLEEMSLIERARKDQAQAVVVRKEKPHGRQ